MSITRRRLLVTTAAIGAVPRLPSAQGKAKPNGRVVIGLSQEPTVFDPRRPHIEVDDGVHQMVYSTLWMVGPNGQLIPRLAAEVPTQANGGLSADGLTWSIKLRPGVTWHDGTPFTSADVAYSIASVTDKNFPAYSRTGHEFVTNIETPAPDRITWKMTKAFAPYMSILAWFFIVPKHKLENEPIVGGHYTENPVGTGPFRWQERVPGDHIGLVANEGYFEGPPLLANVTVKYIPDLTVLFTQYRTGDIDYIGLQGISADHYSEAKKLSDRTVYTAPQATIENFYFNLGFKPFQDRAVRQAIYAAIDKQTIIEQVYYGLRTQSESYLPKQSWAYNPNLPKHEYSLDEAKATLDAAGWKPGADGIREKDGAKLAFSNSTTAGNHLREQTQQLIQQDFQSIGVGMTIKNLPPAVMWGEYWNKSQFETAIVGNNFMVGPDPDASDYFSSSAIAAKTGAGQNTMQYANPEVDRLLLAGAAELDQAKRIPLYQSLQETLREDLGFLPLFQYQLIEGTKGKLAGYEPNINVRLNTWNIASWHWA